MVIRERIIQLFKDYAKLRDQENKILSEIWELLKKHEQKKVI